MSDWDKSLDPIATRLETERPVPRASFRGDLRRLLSRELERRPVQPRRLRLLIAAYAGSGVALLAVAAAGLASVGPFGA
jgi:hypothetical protein